MSAEQDMQHAPQRPGAARAGEGADGVARAATPAAAGSVVAGSPLLSVRGLRTGFVSGRTTLTAVAGIDLDLAAGETFALLGESGCGKSVAALSLMRLLPPAGRILGGEVRLATGALTSGAALGGMPEAAVSAAGNAAAGIDLLRLPEAEMRSVRGRGMAMIFQEPATSLNPVLTVGRQITEALPDLRGGSAEARERATALLAAAGIADPARRLDEYPFQMSGGMKQRVMIAAALAGEPRLLIADEPTTALDVTIQAQILDLLARLQAERGMGILLITHDLGVVARMAQRIGVMYAGEIVEEAPRATFFAAPRHPYTQKLFAALPDSARRGRVLETIPGQVPSLAAMPAGCRFAPRCAFAFDRCRVDSPQWREVAPGHRVRCHLLEVTAGSSASAAVEVSEFVAQGALAAAGDAAAAAATPQAALAAPQATELSAPDAPVTEPLLAVSDLAVHFPIRQGLLRRQVGAVRAVDGVSLTLTRGRTLALVGESGCGKTTVGKAILQLIAPTGGSVRLDGQELVGLSRNALRPLRRRMQMVFQDPFASLNPRLSVGEIIGEGMQALGVAAADGQGGEVGNNRAAAIGALLRQVGLDPAAATRYPHEFSGGQRQRIAIARALAVQPELIVCDEPTSALDVSVQAQILNLLGSLQAELGLAYLFITHNFAVVEHLAHEVAVMYLGRIVERGTVEEVLGAARHPYTQALLAAVPNPRLDAQAAGPGSAQAAAGAPRLAGEMPSPAKPPAGCHFHPRCPLAGEDCRAGYPPAVRLSATHVVHCLRYV
ncbi:ABC transporter ATP-binding protein [Rhodocyclus tenuis]|uniref:Peptide/nickel transport system ATP-binding protein n=1 Tax=Rhodocyclus tenuis TaxID=1066 RepID=A0A840GH71_RHOTE|nr:ABC transporter ATP-binding protein [Rhodocyclus tenuis]MBB4247529.1 peptide/nickel transport system ATP-binding protein [Rhodocyclus tenuis]